MTRQRIEQAVEVVRYAIEHGISVKEASVKCGYSDTYVKNVKREIIEKYDEGIVSKEDYDFFMRNYEMYEGSKGTAHKLEDDLKVNKSQKIEGEQLKVEKSGDMMDVTWQGDKDSFDNTFRATEEQQDYDQEDGEYDEEGYYYGHQGYPDGHITTLDQLLERCDVDQEEWKVEDFLVNKWDVTSWKQGFPQTWENFQVKARLKRVKDVFDAKRFTEIFEEMIKKYQPPTAPATIIPVNDTSEENENNLLEISLFDLHIGKLGWAGEVGENFDVKIAKARFLDAIIGLLNRSKGFNYSKILFPIGNDFFNSDNQFNTTTAGTPQDEDLRWQKTWDMGTELIVDAVNLLKATGVPVEVLVVPGNHDQERSKYLGSFVHAWFRNDPQVTVNNSAKNRKYVEWGEVMLGFTHGKDEKENSLPLLMATEAKEMWGRTTFHEWHLGHFHKKRNVKFTIFDKAQVLNEDLGVTVRYLSSLTGTEEWHYKKGYVGSHKAGEAFVWNDKSGMIGHLNFTFTDFDRED
jgi:hypothetical protein